MSDEPMVTLDIGGTIVTMPERLFETFKRLNPLLDFEGGGAACESASTKRQRRDKAP